MKTEIQKKETKTLANCTTIEFLKQTNRIRHAIAEYLDYTKILEIRKNKPVFTDGMTDEEKKAAIAKQSRKNISDMLDVALEDNAEATARILGLICFTEDEKEIENLDPFAVLDVVMSERVLGFFTRLMQSGLIDTAGTSQKSALNE